MKTSSLVVVLSALALLALASCSKPEPAQNESLYHLVADRPITCSKGPDCDKKWARAIAWVRAHNVSYTRDGRELTYPIQRLTSNVIQTSACPLPEAQFRIMRIPTEDGRYLITYNSQCDLNNDCYKHTGRLLKMDFVSTLIGLPPGVTQTSPRSFSVQPGILPPANIRP